MKALWPLALSLLTVGGAAQARDSLGVFEAWGAFRDPAPAPSGGGPRCYAIAMPVAAKSEGFAAVGSWPRQRVRGQVHFRLSRMRMGDAAVILNVGDRRFTLVAGQVDAWAPDARADAAIVAAMRSATSMSVQTRDARGRGFADTYMLRGAATAIDAAALGCARIR
ncbi:MULTISPECIES: hypothetical protein [Sphingobium]|uniref:hypothetical protein n=1 Tax=Sphingobium TaxID=165695 RepID=UPI00059CCB70